LQAEHPTVAQEWLEALEYLLKEHGRELVDEAAPAGEQKAGDAKTGRRLSVVKPAAPTGPKSDDPFDIMGMDSVPADLVFDENTTFVPASRPENPFGADSVADEWNPFGDASGDVFGASTGTAADPFADAGFGENPFATSNVPPPGLDAELGKYLADVGLMELAPKFLTEHVDLATLRMFTKEDFAGMGVKVGPSVKILATVKTWKASS
jgi:hypothetical protein